jgi:hypothetical protein
VRHYTNKALPLPLIPSLDEGRGWSLPWTPIRGEGEKAVVRPFVASENRDTQFLMLGSLETSQTLTSKIAGRVRPFVGSEPVSDAKD